MRIDILVDKAARSITIRDNGAEIEKSKAQATLLNIGSSSKRHSKSRGFRGIGRLGGMRYCNTLMFYPFKLGLSQPRPIFPIAHMFAYGNPISRSEARRLGTLIADFKEITLDFTGVEEVGQAFCHELFVVWQRNNPDIIVNIVGACDDVDFMIQRAKNTK